MIRRDGALLRQLDTLLRIGTTRELTDGQLLERFATGSGETAEFAFAALVERHGAMVLRVCRGQLGDPHDAQDAFQATFLVLVEKARDLWVRDSLGPWLHQVAFRTASYARSAAARRRGVERRAAENAPDVVASDVGPDQEIGRVLHEEINRLPERYRVPIVLCDLEGHTCEEAARRMGRPVGTVKSWRARGRERLRSRLIRSGLAPSAALATVLTGDVAGAAVWKRGADETARAAARALSDPAAGGVPAAVRTLANGVIKAMFLGKLRTAAACALTLCAAALGAAAWAAADDSTQRPDQPRNGSTRSPREDQPLADAPDARDLGGETWSLPLREAVRIGLENCKVVHVTGPAPGGTPDGGYSIAPASVDKADQRLKAEVMALVRSIEQQYWTLGQRYVDLWAAERAAELADGVVKREVSQQQAGRGNPADLAAARQRAEAFRLDLVRKTSDVISTERRLRNLLGLPPADDRRIVPISKPKEEEVSPDWKTCLATALEKQPDVAQARSEVKEAEARCAAADAHRVAGTFLPALEGLAGRTPAADAAGVSRAGLERRTKFYQQIVHQTTHSLARFFLEVDANYKQFKTASRFRAAAAARLEAQRAFYEEGRITIDRYLDAVGQHASAISQEAQFKASYNTSLIALDEAQGTLLERERITVVDRPRGAATAPDGRDVAAQAAAYESLHALLGRDPRVASEPVPRTPTTVAPSVPRASPAEDRRQGSASPVGDHETKDSGPGLQAAGRTFSFQMTVGNGRRPVQIRGSFTIAPARGTDATEPR